MRLTRSIKLLSRLQVFATLVLPLLLCPGSASAGRLTIEGKSEFTAETSGEMVQLSGYYEMRNGGDEPAFEVFPHATVGDWQWSGEPKNLGVGATYRWEMKGEFALSRMACGKDNRCAGLQLPNQGRMPVFIYRHYKDSNGYSFSAPEVTGTIVGTLSAEEQARLRQQAIIPRLEMAGDGQSFSGTLSLRNSGVRPLDVAVSYFASREFIVESDPSQVSIPAGKSVEVAVKTKNFAVLPGSVYPVYAVMQWEEGSVRQSAGVAAPVHVAVAPNNVMYLAALIVVIIAAATSLVVILRRKA